jgi:tetratricopeptide (TPR) repeat protein
MRNILLVTWLCVPIGAWAYHEGPGQDRAALERTDAILVAAHAAADAGDWAEAAKRYEEALGKLPKDADATPKGLVPRLQLELNKARMQAAGLPTAREELETLVEQLQAEKDADSKLLAEARQALARAQFYTTWLMRLEGLDREVWEPEIEAARQNWRLLAEQTKDQGERATHQQDLEAAIRLARLEIEDLQGLPLPGE